MKYAPIALFAYKRVDKLRQCVEALEKNIDADKTELYIFSDGYKGEEDKEQVGEVRKYIRTIVHKSIFAKVCIIERTHNWGLANSIIDGVTQVINKHGKIIVVEDDLVTTLDFIQYMNGALNYYEHCEEYGSISAYTYPINILKKYNKDIYVTRKGDCWGWGTWKNRWEKVDWLVKDYAEYINNKKKRKLFDSLEYGLDNMLNMQMNGEIDSWAVRWCYHLFKNCLLTVYPSRSRTLNIGLDGSGTHCEAEVNLYGKKIDNLIAKCKYERLPVDYRLEKASSKFAKTVSMKNSLKQLRKKILG